MKTNKIIKIRFVKIFAVTVALFLWILICYSQADDIPKGPINLQTIFTPSGWMGDGEFGRKYVDYSESSDVNPHSGPTCIKVTYVFGPKKWAGIYWQNRADNWGDYRGNNYSNKERTKVTFWSRGEKGGEVVEFKTGGIRNPSKEYSDSFNGTTGRIALTDSWKKYVIDLKGEDLTSVIGGFCWVTSKDYNSAKEITFYIDDIFLE